MTSVARTPPMAPRSRLRTSTATLSSDPVVGVTTSAGSPAGALDEEVVSSEIGFSDMAPSAGVDAGRCAGGRRPNDPRGSLRPAYRFRGILRPA